MNYLFCRNAKGQTPIHVAAVKGRTEEVRLLLDRNGIRGIDYRDNSGKTALHHAANVGSVETVLVLLDNGAAVDAVDDHGRTPLHIVSEGWRSECVDVARLLLARGAAVEASNITDSTPLHFASHRGRFRLMQLLLEEGASVNASNKFGVQPLYYAVKLGQVAVVQLLLDHSADMNARNNTRGIAVLHFVASNGQIVLAKRLLEHGAEVDVKCRDGLTPLCHAAQSHHTEMARFLLKHGADGAMALRLAVRKGDTKVIAFLLDLKIVSVNAPHGTKGCTLLHVASACGQTESAQLLMDRNANVQAATNDGKTPLFLAVVNNQVDTAELLLRHGHVDVHAAVVTGDQRVGSMLHAAIHLGYHQMICLFLRYGAYDGSIVQKTQQDFVRILSNKKGTAENLKKMHFGLALALGFLILFVLGHWGGSINGRAESDNLEF